MIWAPLDGDDGRNIVTSSHYSFILFVVFFLYLFLDIPQGHDISTEIFSASNDNGKINVQVTVLVGEFIIISVEFSQFIVSFSVWYEFHSFII